MAGYGECLEKLVNTRNVGVLLDRKKESEKVSKDAEMERDTRPLATRVSCQRALRTSKVLCALPG